MEDDRMKWRYKSIPLWNVDKPISEDEILNEMGMQEWELVSIRDGDRIGNATFPIAYFKRSIPVEYELVEGTSRAFSHTPLRDSGFIGTVNSSDD